MTDFNNIYSHGFVRAAVCVPRVRIADPVYNLERTLELAGRAHDLKAGIALFPELGLSAYSNDDLFHQDALLDGVLAAIGELVEASREICPVLIVGAPLRFEGKLFNCGLVVHRGRLLGIVPKTYIPNYREFYEKRQFTSGRDAVAREVSVLGKRVPFGSDLIFDAEDLPGLSLHVEICEDLWAPVPPSTYAALAGATVVGNLSASNIIIGKAAYRRDLCAAQSGKCIAAYLYAAAGQGESTTDLAWDGHALIYENNELLAEGPRFSDEEQVIFADLDLERLAQDRMRMTTFNDAVGDHLHRVQAIRRVSFTFDPPAVTVTLSRPLDRFPYVPSAALERDARCYEAYNIQVHGLMQRLRATGIEKLVIGVSGGLDSTQSLIVCARAMDRLGLPRANILAYTMPGFGTGEASKANAWALMRAMGVTAEEIDIRPSSRQMLEDIGHPAADGEAVYDITYENVQAGERTSHLFRLANHHGAMVVGTGDLSELALGWATYGVGDHMSHYNVNASVPKTLIQYLIRWVVATGQLDHETCAVLSAILASEISPELVPADLEGNGQRTEDVVGPYDLQDFHLYFVSRYGFRPSKIAFLAHAAWGDRTRGDWPDGIPEEARPEYDLPTIKKWLEVFLYRFFETSQFKRSASPNGPKVGSGGSLSPRGDWRAPSDASARPWIDELRANVP
jgi:NAD+ synthase (glutamine-hydrolysing)